MKPSALRGKTFQVFGVWSSEFSVRCLEFRVLDLEGLADEIVYNFVRNRLFLGVKPSRSLEFGVQCSE